MELSSRHSAKQCCKIREENRTSSIFREKCYIAVNLIHNICHLCDYQWFIESLNVLGFDKQKAVDEPKEIKTTDELPKEWEAETTNFAFFYPWPMKIFSSTSLKLQ